MRKFYALMLFAVFSITAFAESDGYYYWFYDEVKATPTGKGKIYVTAESVEDGEEIPYQESMTIKECVQGVNYALAFAYVQPAEGYQFVGWYTDDPDQATWADKVGNAGDMLSASTEVSSEDNTVEQYGFEPDVTFYGVFGKVNIALADGMDQLGTLNISKIANDTGDKITLTATPFDESAQFAYWQDSKGNQITENPYELTVSDVETYTAYFKGDAVQTIDFGEGKYIPFSNAKSATFSEGITVYTMEPVYKVFWDDDGNFVAYDELTNQWGWYEEEYDDDWNLISSEFHQYTGEVPEFPASYRLDTSYGYTAGEGALLYGEGEQTVILYEDEYAYESETNKLVGTSAGAVNIADLPKTDEDGNAMNYYIFDGADFVKATTGTVPQNECYLALNAAEYPLPDKILVSSEEADGIRSVATPSAAPQFIGIYTIDGKQVKAPVKGLNVINGKKVLVK